LTWADGDPVEAIFRARALDLPLRGRHRLCWTSRGQRDGWDDRHHRLYVLSFIEIDTGW